MSEIPRGIAVLFGTQAAKGQYNDALEASPAALTVALAPGADAQVAGLLLGDAGSGVGKSGLSLGTRRVASDKGVVGSGFTKPLSDFERLEVDQFDFVTPFCGNRNTLSLPVDADYEPNPALVAMMAGMGLSGSDWSGGQGRSFKFDPANVNPISAMVYYNGLRAKYLDCRVSGRIVFRPSARPLLTGSVAVGSIVEVTETALPTGANLDYSPLDDESPPITGTPATGFQWGQARGFNALELLIAPAIGQTEDSEADGGIRKSIDDIVATIRATLFEDDADTDFSYQQAIATSSGVLAPLSFTVGALAGDGDVAKAVSVSMPQPEEQSFRLNELDGKAAADVEVVARHSTANQELELIFP